MSAPEKYRKKPVEIDAMLWDGTADAATPIINWALENGVTITYHCPDGDACRRDTHVLMVSTLEGAMAAIPGDWIIRGVAGEFYPCKPDIFAATYDAVPTETAMTRDEAIDHVWGLSMQVAGEFCVGRTEEDALERETREALQALGVTDSELT
ncbi:hypothetical protein A5784_35045 [Mycobacterium sp. 852013-50091_SCH5140682]|nr:hypothetical protein A5784_35045 [Mycobacterium sp. 852013-50091_SCH5140682]